MKLELTESQLSEIRAYIVENIMRNSDIMLLNDRVYRDEAGERDLVEVIASLYELIHQMTTGEPYRYMFHWANKVGAWVEDDVFDPYTLEGQSLVPTI